LGRKTVLLFAEAYLFLGMARLWLLFPFARIAHLLGAISQETPLDHPGTDTAAAIKHITSAVNTMSRYTLWESKCLVRAIAGMKMLKRRNIESTLYLGTAKDEAGGLIAHAWLRSGPYYITGQDVMSKFVVVERFAKTRSIR
jgi:hypothetical protein